MQVQDRNKMCVQFPRMFALPSALGMPNININTQHQFYRSIFIDLFTVKGINLTTFKHGNGTRNSQEYDTFVI
jgi:hypothetical protein